MHIIMEITVDILELEAPAYPKYQPVPDMFPTVTPCSPVRFVIDLKSKSLVERSAMAYDRSPDFPTPYKHLGGKPYSDFWMLGISASGKTGRKFFDQLAHGSWERRAVDDIYQTAPGQYWAASLAPCQTRRIRKTPSSSTSSSTPSETGARSCCSRRSTWPKAPS